MITPRSNSVDISVSSRSLVTPVACLVYPCLLCVLWIILVDNCAVMTQQLPNLVSFLASSVQAERGPTVRFGL